MSERNLQILGWAGTCLSVIMYISYCAEYNGKFRRQQSPVSPAARSRDKLHDIA